MVPQVAHMCKGEISHRDATMLAPLALFLNQYFNTFISEGPLLYLALVWVTLDLMWYCAKVIPEKLLTGPQLPLLGLFGDLCIPGCASLHHTTCDRASGHWAYKSLNKHKFIRRIYFR